MHQQPEMPRKPRSHVVETESRRAFRNVIPAEWVPHTVEPDYGTDELVEIFENDAATGLAFYVQLRGTDEPDTNRALATRFKRKQLNYFSALDLPVLLVRYHAPSQRLFAQWFHRLELDYPGHTTSIRFPENDELKAASSSQIAAEVRAVRQFRPTTLVWPITFSVSIREIDDDLDCGVHEFVVACSALAGDEQPYVRFTAAEQLKDIPSVHVASRRVTIDLAVTRVTIESEAQSVDELAADAVLSIALAMGKLGHTDVATHLAVKAGPRSNLLDNPSWLLRFSAFFLSGRRLSDALELGRALERVSRSAARDFLVSTVALLGSRLWNSAERREYVGSLEKTAETALTSQQPTVAAACHYTLGNWLFHVDRNYSGALKHYELAAVHDRSYTQRPYYLRERAAALFETHSYSSSVEWYERALRLESEPSTRARLADALAHAGRYDDAAKQFKLYLEESSPSRPVWNLYCQALDWLAEDGTAQQNRRVEEAERLVREAEAIDETPRKRELLDAAIAADRFCGSAWFLVGKGIVNQDQRYADALMPLLIGCLNAGNPEVWADLLLVALYADRIDLAELIAAAAHETHGTAFQDALRRVGQQLPKDGREMLLSVVDEELRKGGSVGQAVTLRAQDEAGEMREYRVELPHGLG